MSSLPSSASRPIPASSTAGLCDPPIDPCEIAPQLCEEEPPVLEPAEEFPFAAILTGTAKIKSEVLVSGLGEVVFKANVTGLVSVD